VRERGGPEAAPHRVMAAGAGGPAPREVMVSPVQEGHAHRTSRQSGSGLQAGEAASHDDHVWDRSVAPHARIV
jgi:hypothetical protein